MQDFGRGETAGDEAAFAERVDAAPSMPTLPARRISRREIPSQSFGPRSMMDSMVQFNEGEIASKL